MIGMNLVDHCTMKCRSILSVSLAASLVVSSAVAADSADSALAVQPGCNEACLTLYFDNDLFGGTDEDSANSVRPSWVSEAKPLAQLGSSFYQSLDGFSDFTRIRSKSSPWVYNTGVRLTQLMFTPTDTATATLIEDDRPCAEGWTGPGLSLHATNEDEILVSTPAPEGRAVACDIFLDGNTFDDSHSVDGEYFVPDLTGVVGLRYKALNLAYAYTYRTQEYGEQKRGQFVGPRS